MEDNINEVVSSEENDTAKIETTQPSETDVVNEPQATEEDIHAKYTKLENDFKSVTGKVSSLQKEKNKLDQVAVIYEALNRAAISDPEFKKLANKKLAEAGLIDSSELEDTQTSTIPTNKVATQKVDPAIEWARQKKQAEEDAQIRYFQKFEENKPEITSEGDELAILNRQVIGAGAKVFMKRGMSFEDAYNKAYLQWFKAKQDADVDALLKEKSTPNIGGGLGGSTSKPATNLSEAEKRIARQFKMTDAEYAERRQK